MKNFTLKSFLTSNLDIDENEILSIQKRCKVKEYSKDALLLGNNQHVGQTFFVEEGLLRQYTTDEKGREFIMQFAPEGWFITDFVSTDVNVPLRYYIQALEPTRISFVDEEFINNMRSLPPVLNDFNHIMLYNQINFLQARVEMLLSKSAAERYLHFIKTYPDILMRVPQTMVASYLGITPESLSRVRCDLAKKNCRN